MTFSYHRSLSPIVGVVLALALVETCVIHIVVMAYWGWKVALVLGLADLSLVVMLIGLLRSFRTRPIVLADGVLTMRTGQRMVVSIPVEQIAALRERWSAEDLKGGDVLNMALAAWPNVMLDLNRPIRRRRKHISSVAHCVDDPLAFRRALEAALGNGVLRTGSS